MKEVDVNSLEQISWRCQNHVVFAPKYRKIENYGEIHGAKWSKKERGKDLNLNLTNRKNSWL